MISTVLLDCAIWATAGVAAGYAGARTPDAALRRWVFPWGVTRPERLLYRLLAVKRWKDRVPELGTVFGGRSKRHLRRRDVVGLREFEVETRRAELVHWSQIAVGWTFLLWNPPVLAGAMLVYAFVANVPCIVIQRFNRERIVRMTG